MKIAVEGCAHGDLERIYDAIEYLEKENAITIDLLICCGDFQAVRNEQDLKCMAVPTNYQKMNTFYKYYSGEKFAPILTLFIGGNHEASNYLGELAYGGWVCPNIYYFGYASILNVGGVRIAGLSGIYKGQDYLKGHHEFPPYNEDTVRSAYHIRNVDVFRLKQITRPVDIFLSHDWPRGVYHFGDLAALLRKKPFFRDDIETGKLGSRPTQELLEKLQPSYWFSAHLHVKFAALVSHDQSEPAESQKKVTKFLALDKCLPRREYLQILDIGPKVDKDGLHLEYDAEWLCILKSTNHLLNIDNCIRYMPGPGCRERFDFKVSEEELEGVRQLLNNDLKIPLNFRQTVPCYDPKMPRKSKDKASIMINHQTTEFCSKLDIMDPFQKLLDGASRKSVSDVILTPSTFHSQSEANVTLTEDSQHNVSGNISLDSTGVTFDEEDDEDDDDDTTDTDRGFRDGPGYSDLSLSQSTNPDEISLNDDDDGEEQEEEDVVVLSDSPRQPAAILPSLCVSTPEVILLDSPLRDELPSRPPTRSSISGCLPAANQLQPVDPLDTIVSDVGCSPESGAESSACSSNPSIGPALPSVSDVSSAELVAPVVKALKRRNQAIYAVVDDDSAED